MATEAVLYARDVETLAAFYLHCIGLTPVESGSGYCGLRADGLILWLVRGQQAQGDDAGGDHPPRRRSEVPVKLAFEVASIEEVAGVIGAFVGSLTPARREFAGHHRRDAIDPEGNVIQLLEPHAKPE